MELNYGDHRPIYEQIKEKTKEYIINGAMAEHERLPILTVQFHPERMAFALARPDTADGAAIFRWFQKQL